MRLSVIKCDVCGKAIRKLDYGYICDDCLDKMSNNAEAKKRPVPHGCPFCEPPSDAAPEIQGIIDNEFDEKWYYVECEGCGARSGEYATPEIAVNAWNAATDKGTAE